MLEHLALSLPFFNWLSVITHDIILVVSNYFNVSLQFMTEMKETAFIMQNVSSRYFYLVAED
jgi:hypothetical protein